MKQGIAKTTFRRCDTGKRVRRGSVVIGEDAYLNDLARNGLVYETTAHVEAPEMAAHPSKAAGAKSPASQAAQASPAKTAKRSGRGGRRKKEGLSSQ